jgi:transcription antitermination factor NusG
MHNINKTKTDWYVLYTAPRAEKVVYLELTNKNFDVFLPTTKELKVWKNRQKKWIDKVLFPSYIFVNTQAHELFQIKQVPKVATYLHIAGKPSIVPHTVIEGLKKMISMDENLTVSTDFCEGEKVKIVHGPLTGYEGILVQKKGKARFGMQINEINQTVFVDVCTDILEKLHESHHAF